MNTDPERWQRILPEFGLLLGLGFAATLAWQIHQEDRFERAQVTLHVNHQAEPVRFTTTNTADTRWSSDDAKRAHDDAPQAEVLSIEGSGDENLEETLALQSLLIEESKVF
jgi:hypothetical protein